MESISGDFILPQSMAPRTNKKSKLPAGPPANPERLVWVAFFVSLALLALGLVFPEKRIWGLSQWSHFPVHFALAALVAAVVVGVLSGRYLTRSSQPAETEMYHRQYFYFSLVMVVLLGAAFYLLRGRIHFLGDGYTLLANLASDEPIVKLRNLGETLAHQFVYALLDGDNYQRSLTAYRIVSISGGLIFAITVLVGARLLFESTRGRVLFSLGLLSGGYMLLFFGYAEHYSLFVAVVGLFGLMGLLIARGKLHRLWILVPLGLAIFLHVFGVILIPAGVYLLLTGTRVSKVWLRMASWVRLVVGLVVVAAASTLFYHYFTTNFFFRFSFVPIVRDQFTLEGYTVFSLKHLADAGNLLLLLFPGILVVAAYLFGARVQRKWREADHVFLLIFLVTCFVSVFVFDPKQGMPRDWDLFSFCGVPLVLTGLYMILRNHAEVRAAAVTVVLAVVLGFVFLIPRVVAQVVPRLGLAQVFDYARMDLKKSQFFLLQLHQYYWDNGQYERSPLLTFDYDEKFPEYTLLMTALELAKQGNCADAVPLLKQAIALHPTMVPPYANLGSCYIDMGFPDSAVLPLRIADGLSPYRVLTLVDLGTAYLLKGDLEQARKYFVQALEIDSDLMTARAKLLEVYSISGDFDEYVRLLQETAGMESAPASVHKLLGDYYAQQRLIDQAREEYFLAIRKGLSEEQVREIMETFPDLFP